METFRPSYCPRTACPTHLVPDLPFRYERNGWYRTKRCPDKKPRFRCKTCESSFSLTAFSVAYYLRRPELLCAVAAGLVAGSALRQLARSLGVSHTTIARHAARLGRHAVRLLALAQDHLKPVEEALCFDHFETFELTQDLPFGVGTLVGHASWYVHHLDPAPHARGGRMSPAQRARAARRTPTPRKGGYRRSFVRSVDVAMRVIPPGSALTLVTDDKPEYRRGLRLHPDRRRVRHRVYRNPPRGPKGSRRSAEARQRDRAMFPCDLLHRILRHAQAHHRRETIAFGRRLNAIMERMALFALWRNFVQRQSERHRRSPTPAMVLGLADRAWSWKRVLARRIFGWEVRLPEPWPTLYQRRWPTPELGRNTVHRLKYAD